MQIKCQRSTSKLNRFRLLDWWMPGKTLCCYTPAKVARTVSHAPPGHLHALRTSQRTYSSSFVWQRISINALYFAIRQQKIASEFWNCSTISTMQQDATKIPTKDRLLWSACFANEIVSLIKAISNDQQLELPELPFSIWSYVWMQFVASARWWPTHAVSHLRKPRNMGIHEIKQKLNNTQLSSENEFFTVNAFDSICILSLLIDGKGPNLVEFGQAPVFSFPNHIMLKSFRRLIVRAPGAYCILLALYRQQVSVPGRRTSVRLPLHIDGQDLATIITIITIHHNSAQFFNCQRMWK